MRDQVHVFSNHATFELTEKYNFYFELLGAIVTLNEVKVIESGMNQ